MRKAGVYTVAAQIDGLAPIKRVSDHQRDDGHTLELHLPWGPSANDFKIPHPKVRGLYFLTKRAKQFRLDVQKLCIGARRFGAEAEILLDITLHPPDKRKRDADNFAGKALFDALQAAEIFADDSQIESYRVTKSTVVKGGLVVVKVSQRENIKC